MGDLLELSRYSLISYPYSVNCLGLAKITVEHFLSPNDPMINYHNLSLLCKTVNSHKSPEKDVFFIGRSTGRDILLK